MIKVIVVMAVSVAIVLGLSVPSIDAWDMQHHGVLNYIGGCLAGFICGRLLGE
jgi:hypothetical protein